jgi:hypothetical protein
VREGALAESRSSTNVTPIGAKFDRPALKGFNRRRLKPLLEPREVEIGAESKLEGLSQDR